MCFGSRGEGRAEQPRPVELRSRNTIPRGIQEPETLRQLGYVAFESGYMPDPIDPIGSPDIFCHTINLVNSGPYAQHIAILGADEERGLLVVKEIYMNADIRQPGPRPIAAAVLLSFWHHELRHDIHNLRTIFFDTVTETTLMRVRDEICEHMDLDRLDRLAVSRHSETGTEQNLFKKVYNETPFGKCARTIVTQNLEMERAGIEVSRFEFQPIEPSGYYFHFSVALRGPSAHQSQRQGHGRRH